MDPSSHERRGPQVYVHLEFGLSWNSKPPKNHELTYKSRGLRDRSPAFPRQVPAPNTNYLAAIHDFDQRHTTRPHNRAVPPACHNPLTRDHQMQEYYQAGIHLPYRTPHQQHPAAHEQRRASRAESSSSHERGRSAPPPIGENPWDESIGAHHRVDGPSRAQNATPPDQWKALPVPPSMYRLGEDGMPWSSWSWPLGYEPETSPRDDDSGTAHTTQPHEHTTPYEASPMSVSVFSPGPSSDPKRTRDVETGRARELGALSAAMMTVDNGFENQWWNQGPREPVQRRLTDEMAAAPANPPMLSRNRWSARSLGWAVAESSPEQTQTSATMRSFNPSDIVSPISEHLTLSPSPSYQSVSVHPQLLQRSMSTRSEELWFSERGGGVMMG